jgi:hypothetical protein
MNMTWEHDRSEQATNPLNDDMDEWDRYEEDGPLDLEDQLDAAFARADQLQRG